MFCEHLLERKVTPDNVIPLLEASDACQAHDVKNYALSLIVQLFGKMGLKQKVVNLPRNLILDILIALEDAALPGLLNDPK